MTACMGGWCTRKDKCAHYHADSADISERLCQPGEANAFSPIKEVKMKRSNEASAAAIAARVHATLDAVAASLDDSGQTVNQLLAKHPSMQSSCMSRYMERLLECGRAFRASVSNKLIGGKPRGKCFQYFRSEAAAAERQKQSDEFMSANLQAYEDERAKRRKAERAANPKRRGPKKRHANQKPLTVVGGLSKRKPTQKQADTAQMLARVRIQESANYRPKGDNTPAVPPPGKSIKQLPGFTGRTRYSVDGPVTGPFSSLPPGKYAFEAVSAAARAAA